MPREEDARDSTEGARDVGEFPDPVREEGDVESESHRDGLVAESTAWRRRRTGL